jgi:amino acid transporter
MVVQAVTVFLAMIGTTLSCINTGARVTYAMGRDEEVPNHFGLLHGKNNTPHRCIWVLATLSMVIGIIGIIFYLCGPAAIFSPTALTPAQAASFWYKGAFTDPTHAAKFPNSFLTITLISNFGTFLLYMMSCLCAVVAFHEHQLHNPIKHILIPVFGLLANLACMLFYLIGPFSVAGMSWKESYIALGVAAVWGIYGAIYFLGRSKKLGRDVMLTKPTTASV